MARATLVFILSAHLLRAQEPLKEVAIHSHPYTPPSAVLRAETSLVEADLTVRDSHGKTIAGLRPSDFEVLDNGAPQQITAFTELRSDGKTAAASESLPAADIPKAEPRYVTFFFDDNHLDSARMQVARRAAHDFVAKGLKPEDRISIVTASGQGDLDFTSDAKLFDDTLDRLASHTRTVDAANCGVSATDSYIFLNNLDSQTYENAVTAAKPCACGGGEQSQECRIRAISVARTQATTSWEQTQAHSILTMEALGLAAKKLSEVNGKRILVLTSSGFLIRPGQPEVESFIDGATRWNVVVHALDANGLNANVGGRMGLHSQTLFWTPLEKLADGTGGHFFKNTNDLAGALDLAANPEVTYLLAFNPGARDGKFHTLKIRFKTRRPETIQFRHGYFSPVETPNKTQAARTPMDAAVFSKEALTDIPVTVELQPSPSGVSITITLDVNQLKFNAFQDRHAQQIVFLMTLLDTNGAFVTGKEAIMDLALTDAKLAALLRDGLKAVATLDAPPGKYQVRTIVREGMKGALAASTQQLELPK